MANSKEIVDEFLNIIWAESERRWGKDFTVKDVVYHLVENDMLLYFDVI